MEKEIFNQFLSAVATYYKADPSLVMNGKFFNLRAPEAALLGKNIQQRSDFLQKINMFNVSHVKGDKLLGAVEKGITGRHPDKRHQAKLDHSQQGYELAVTDSGVIIPWTMFDNFAVFGDQLAALYAEYVQTQIALDQMQIGWHGVSAADNTKKDDLSDVNIGWLQHLRNQRPDNVYKGNTSNQIKIFGEGAEYGSLDELALDLKQGLAFRHQNRTDLVFLVGAELANAESRFISKAAKLKPTERAALNSSALMGSFGGMQSITPPNFPAKGAVVTTLSNLSIYTQSASQRRRIKDDDDKMGIVDSYYRMEGYVVEDLDLMTAIEADNVIIGKPEENKNEQNATASS